MIVKNAMKNLGRNKGRTLLVTAAAGIVMLASACSIVVHTSAKQLAQQQKQAIGAQVIVTRNDDKLSKDPSGYREISVNQMKAFTNSSLIQSSAIYASTLGRSDLKMVEGSGFSNGIQQDNTPDTSATNPIFDTNAASPNIMLIGSTHEKASDDFVSGLRKIKEGTMYQKPGEVLIGETLAQKNNLKVGDSFEVKLIDLASAGKVPVLKLTIAGIFEDHKPASDGDFGYLNKNNEVWMSYETIQTLQGSDTTSGMITVEGSFSLKNPDDVEALQKEFIQKGMPQFFELSVNRNAYEKSVAPIIQVADMTQWFSIVMLSAGALIMIALSLMSIRERKYEIGVLRAMGLKKQSIRLMLCLEMCTISLGCALIALIIAKLGAQPIADWMLSGIETTESIQFGALLAGSGNISAVTSIPAELSIEAIVLILVSAITLGLLASIGGVWYITKNEPMRILAERN